MKRELILIAHNIRSTHNVGALLRTADGMGVGKVYLTGYTPYPVAKNDERLPHIAQKLDKQIQKTALGAQNSVDWVHELDINKIVNELKQANYHILALEQTKNSQPLPTFKPSEKLAIIVGREVEGVEPEVLALCQSAIEIPMLGAKKSLNVAQAAAIALYHCRFTE